MIYPTITLPPIEEVVPGVDPENPTDEQDRAWNAHCAELVLAFAREHGGYVRTHYPFDAEDGSTDDTVHLDANGAILVIDQGVSL